MSVLSTIPLDVKKAFVRYDDDDDEEVGSHVPVLPEAGMPFDHFHRQENDGMIFVPEMRSTLAQYDDSSDDNGGIGSLVKRGLGRCIHRCLRGPSRMSFIQCKSMCHR